MPASSQIVRAYLVIQEFFPRCFWLQSLHSFYRLKESHLVPRDVHRNERRTRKITWPCLLRSLDDANRCTKLKQRIFHLPFQSVSDQCCLLVWISFIFVIFSGVIIMICLLKKKLLMSVYRKKKKLNRNISKKCHNWL